MIKKFKTWVLSNWNIIRYFFYFLILILIWISIWVMFYQDDYILDLSVSVSDFLQLLVIGAAIFAPLLVDYIRKKTESPIINIILYHDGRNIVKKQQKIYSADKEIPKSAFASTIFCLTIKNAGKSLLADCEAVLSKIIMVENKKVIAEIEYPQTNLKWLGFFRTERISINPQRERRLAILFFSQFTSKEPSDVEFTIYDSNEDYFQMLNLPIGTYFFIINFYSSNAKTRFALVKFIFSGGQKEKTGQWEYWYPRGHMEICEIKDNISELSDDVSAYL